MTTEHQQHSPAYVSNLEQQLEQAANQIKDMTEYVKGQERLSQLRAWAIDRAVSIYQINRSASSVPSFADIHALAEQIVTYANGQEYTDLVNAQPPVIQ